MTPRRRHCGFFGMAPCRRHCGFFGMAPRRRHCGFFGMTLWRSRCRTTGGCFRKTPREFMRLNNSVCALNNHKNIKEANKFC
jgi:hypothetical protein